jgi:benzoyl-CoA reductase/2-hydroxyglutaryl-CoA dehydratase subunit BcrC/BadD/HgdB
MRKIGITTTVPAEFIFAADCRPLDLNNIFINAKNREKLIMEAETDGFPRTVCGWIKGIYAVAAEHTAEIIAVTEGDCSQTHALMETLEEKGIKIIPFAYPFINDENKRRPLLRLELEQLAENLGCSFAAGQKEKQRLDEARRPVWEIDALSWRENTVSGAESHYWQVSCSDFEGDPELFAASAWEFIREIKDRKPAEKELRLALLGVPPIIDGIHENLAQLGARVVFNEIPRQFSMPFDHQDITEQYLAYTYPRPLKFRIADIQKEITRRRVDAVLHYAQSFCFRQIEDIILRKYIKLPFLSLEGDCPGPLDARTRLRLETFVSIQRALIFN